jgi:N-methylhydantoinase B/oxoprolinase/acetone carboxylase alpha subunit
MKRDTTVGFAYMGVHLLLLGFIAFPTVVLAGGKDYPIQGTVTALGTSQETSSGGSTGVAGGSTSVVTHVHRTYTVKTPTRVFVLECPYWMDGFHIYSASECGGKKKIEIGDAIRFRVEKGRAHLLTAEGKEQKLRVISEAMKEAWNEVPPASHQP